MQELVLYIAKSLVNNPDKVSVNTIENANENVIELRVDPSDLGRVIGKGGRIAKSIRTIVTSATPIEEKKVFVKIVE